MLIVLDVKREKSLTLSRRLRSLFQPYEITARVKKQNKVTVLYLCYHAYRGEIRYKKLYEYAVGAPKTILCSQELDLSRTPFRRFESNALDKCLMQNFVLHLLRETGRLSQPLRIAYYDPMAENPAYLGKLLQETSALTVVSSMPRFYERESERLMEQWGVPLLVTNTPEGLSNCDILIAPDTITRHLPLSERTLVFTTARPAVSLKGTVIYEYFPEFPYRYQRLRAQTVAEGYFLSALYSLGGVKELAGLLPEKCGDGNTLYTADRLVQRLRHLKEPQELLCAE